MTDAAERGYRSSRRGVRTRRAAIQRWILSAAALAPLMFGMGLLGPGVTEQILATSMEQVPAFELDPLWPRIPAEWKLGDVPSVAVDAHDHVWVLHRPRTLAPEDERTQAPLDIPDAFREHAELMFDLQFLAYQADMTRVVSFQMARELSSRTYPEIGVAEAHHDLSHHQNNPERMAKNAKINTYHVELFAHLVKRMHETPDGDGSLLDHAIVGRCLLVQAGTDQPRQSLLETQQLRSSFVQTRPIILNVVHERRKPDRVLPRE